MGGFNIMRSWLIVASLAISATGVFADTAQENLKDASEVFTEIMAAPDRGIPQDLLAKSQCVVVIPSLKKGAFIVGAEYGRGVAECRRPERGWGAPAMLRVEGGSVGLQIGGTSTDVVLLVMDQRGMDKLMSDKFTLGADAAVAAGPVGRTAQAATDVQLHAEILAWSRSRGAFAGISLSGATLRPDDKRNEELYGHKVAVREVLTGNMTRPEAIRPLIAELDKYSDRGGDSADRQRR
jgi:lipid-binding SYLF domain-containing protein